MFWMKPSNLGTEEGCVFWWEYQLTDKYSFSQNLISKLHLNFPYLFKCRCHPAIPNPCRRHFIKELKHFGKNSIFPHLLKEEWG